MMIRIVAACAMLAFAAACTPSAPKADAEKAQTGCPDDGPRLPITGVCAGRAVAYFDPSVAPATPLELSGPAKDCTWVVNELSMGIDDEALLYRALSCNGVTTKLSYAGGARSAALQLETSALGATPGAELVRIFTSDPKDPQAAIRFVIADAPAAERPKCEVQPAGRDYWPKDALIITYKPAFQQELETDAPNSICGSFGVDEDSQRFWRIQQGYAWFFQLGQDAAEIDPAAIVLMRKGADGVWNPVE